MYLLFIKMQLFCHVLYCFDFAVIFVPQLGEGVWRS